MGGPSQGFLQTRLAGRELGLWLVMAVFLAAFVGFGGGVLFWSAGVREWRAHRESAAWPEVMGRVVSIGYPRQSRTLSLYYEYEHAGRRFRTAHVVFGATARGEMAAFDQRYDVGDPVTVYVDPGDPSRAVLERRLGSRFWLMPGFGLVLAGVGIVVVGFIWRASAPKP